VFGVDVAAAGSCNAGSTNFNFTLGATNTCDNGDTNLTGDGPNGLFVELTGTDANTRPVIGFASGGNGAGVIGVSGSTNSVGAFSAGVAGGLNPDAPAADSAGVRGTSYSTGANGAGVWGNHQRFSGSAPGVLGDTYSTTDFAQGTLGVIQATNPGVGSAGVRGINNGTGANGVGVWGSHASSGWGVYGSSPSGYGVVGGSTTGFAGYFFGKVFVNGTLSKSAGGFKIDHPLDPAHAYLNHSFVESPDMKDVYDGVVTTDRRGFATVRLPHYFQALNRTFRYQLTILGTRGWNARVVREIAHNRFTIQSDQPRVKVSWQATGIRHDAYANAHRIKVVESKSAAAQGRYLQPGLYGQPRSKSELLPPRSVAAKGVLAPQK
jgi:hypothetical protein